MNSKLSRTPQALACAVYSPKIPLMKLWNNEGCVRVEVYEQVRDTVLFQLRFKEKLLLRKMSLKGPVSLLFLTKRLKKAPLIKAEVLLDK